MHEKAKGLKYCKWNELTVLNTFIIDKVYIPVLNLKKKKTQKTINEKP